MEKRGQFYIIAAVILVGIIIGFAALRTAIREEREITRVYDLGQELNIETGNVYDYGVFRGENIDDKIQEWASDYAEYAQGQEVEDWILVYGNENEVTPIVFTTEVSGEIGLEIGGSPVNVEIHEGEAIPQEKIVNPGEEFEVKFKDFSHKFKLKGGENFFFVIKSGGYTAEG